MLQKNWHFTLLIWHCSKVQSTYNVTHTNFKMYVLLDFQTHIIRGHLKKLLYNGERYSGGNALFFMECILWYAMLHREIGNHYHSCCANNPMSPYSNVTQCLTDRYLPDYLPSTPCCRHKMKNFHICTSSITNPKKR